MRSLAAAAQAALAVNQATAAAVTEALMLAETGAAGLPHTCSRFAGISLVCMSLNAEFLFACLCIFSSVPPVLSLLRLHRLAD